MPNVVCEKKERNSICNMARENTEKLKSVTAELNGILYVLRCHNSTDGKKPEFTTECLSDEVAAQSEIINELLDLCVRIKIELIC